MGVARAYLNLLRQPRHAEQLRALLLLGGSDPLRLDLQRGGRLGGHVRLCLRGQLALRSGRGRGTAGGQGCGSGLDGGSSLLGGLGRRLGGLAGSHSGCSWTQVRDKSNGAE